MKESIKYLASLLGNYKKRLFLVFIFAILSTVFAILGPKFIGIITTEVFEGFIKSITGDGGINFEFITKWAIILIVLYVVSSIFAILQNTIMAKVANNIAFNLRRKISKKINKLSMKYFDQKNHGETLSIITNDVDLLTQMLSQSITTLITGTVTIVGIIIIMFTINWIMAVVSLIMVPLIMIIVKSIVKKSQTYFDNNQKVLGDMSGFIEESYAGHDIIQSFNGEKSSIKEFKDINEDLYDNAWKSQFFTNLMQPLMTFIGNFGYVVISILGGYLVTKNKTQVGDIVSFTQYIRQLTQQITQVAQVISNLQSALAATKRVKEFLELEEEVNNCKDAYSIQKIKSDVEFKKVSFGYDKKLVIDNFSIKVKEGQKVAIVGPTGAGKSTIIKLLMRFYELNSGSILIDGKDITKFNRNEFRTLFGMVSQDSWLFNGTIKENIHYGNLNATHKEVEEACIAANVDHFIKTLPNGYDMVINEEADNISIGQKQLMTIARVILANPKILILDEATSNVDTRTEKLIQKAMDNVMKGRTSFVIAHRLSTIKNADVIIVMENGKIVEHGNHNNLISKDGHYAKLYNSQFEEVKSQNTKVSKTKSPTKKKETTKKKVVKKSKAKKKK